MITGVFVQVRKAPPMRLEQRRVTMVVCYSGERAFEKRRRTQDIGSGKKFKNYIKFLDRLASAGRHWPSAHSARLMYQIESCSVMRRGSRYAGHGKDRVYLAYLGRLVAVDEIAS